MTDRYLVPSTPSLAEPVTYTYDDTFAAICIMEEIIEPKLDGAPWDAMRLAIGINELRDRVITNLCKACEAAWVMANKLHDDVFRTWSQRRADCEITDTPFYDEQPADPGSFDYDFVPFWVHQCVDWSDLINGPRVKGGGS